jgi:hypothetical protein
MSKPQKTKETHRLTYEHDESIPVSDTSVVVLMAPRLAEGFVCLEEHKCLSTMAQQEKNHGD